MKITKTPILLHFFDTKSDKDLKNKMEKSLRQHKLQFGIDEDVRGSIHSCGSHLFFPNIDSFPRGVREEGRVTLLGYHCYLNASSKLGNYL